MGAALRPLTGDCQDGYGRTYDPVGFLTYEGRFKGGRYHGPGRLIDERSGRVVTARFVDGLADGPGIVVEAPAPPLGRQPSHTARRVRFQSGVEVDQVIVQHGPPKNRRRPSIDGYEFGPWIASRGKVVSGDPAGGHAWIDFAGLGTVNGNFIDGVAQGEMVLRTSGGDVKLYECVDGIPALARWIVAKDEARMHRYRDYPQDFTIGDCLRGNSRLGIATLVYGNGRVYVGEVKDGHPHGHGELRGDDGFRETGTFVHGVKHGRFLVELAGSLFSDYAITYNNGEKGEVERLEFLTNSAKEPESDWVDLPDQFDICSTCRGLGTYYTASRNVDEVQTSAFRPGDRNYGSWLWRGYAHKTGRQVSVGGDQVPCSRCGGTGSIRTPGGTVPRAWLKSRR